jgi:DNA (cytosine-5)-methyltransferase 1
LLKEKQVGGPLNCTNSELDIYLRELEAGYLPTSCSGTNRSLLSKSKTIREKYWSKDKPMESCHSFQPLETSKTSTEHPGEEQLMFFAEVFPCQDISAAGKGAGITGERSGLWKEYARLIGEMRPRFVFAENSPLLRTRGLGVVLEDLASLGYNARWGVLGARDVGAPHKRDRMWVLAYANNNGNSPTKESKSIAQGSNSGTSRPKQTIEPSGLCASRTDGSMEGSPEELAYAMHQGLQGDEYARGLDSQGRQESDGSTSECGGLWWHTDPAESPTEPLVGRVANGVANRVDRLKAIGNGQVPQCAAMAFSILSEGLI